MNRSDIPDPKVLSATRGPVPRSMGPKKYPVTMTSPLDGTIVTQLMLAPWSPPLLMLQKCAGTTARLGDAKRQSSTTSVAPRRVAGVLIWAASKGCVVGLHAE